jgi:hypothetical protein
MTDSSLGQKILDSSNNRVGDFVKVMPLLIVYMTIGHSATAKLIKIDANRFW